MDERDDFDGTSGSIECYGLLFTGIILFINGFWLVNRLKKKQVQVSTTIERANFNKEICSLWLILSLFSVSYLVGAFWDYFISPKVTTKYSYTIWKVSIGVLFDCIPVMLIMILHLRNFNEKLLTTKEIRKTAVRASRSNIESEKSEAEVVMIDFISLGSNDKSQIKR